MYLRIGKRIVNTDTMTDAEIIAEPDGQRTVVVTTTAIARTSDGALDARRITLSGEDAELFLSALPTYSPVWEPVPEPEHEIEGEG